MRTSTYALLIIVILTIALFAYILLTTIPNPSGGVPG